MSKNKWIIIGILAIVIGFTIANIVGVNRVKKNINPSLTSILLPTVKDFYKIGEVVKINNISMIIDKIEISNGIKADRPDVGKEYLIVTVTVKNENKSKISYDNNDFQIQDAKGHVSNSVVTTLDANQTFKDGGLAPNREITGTMTFLASKGGSGLSLIYNGDIFGNTIVRFKLN